MWTEGLGCAYGLTAVFSSNVSSLYVLRFVCERLYAGRSETGSIDGLDLVMLSTLFGIGCSAILDEFEQLDVYELLDRICISRLPVDFLLYLSDPDQYGGLRN